MRAVNKKIDFRTKLSPPQVFGVGLGKTGTTTLNQVLNELGYNSVHYPLSLNTILDGTYNAAADTLIAIQYKYLKQKFPEAKFICTIRNKQLWLDSFENHFKKPSTKALTYNDRAMSLRNELYGSTVFSRENYSNVFSEHIDGILHVFNKDMDKILFLDITDPVQDPWGKICGFLNCSVPAIKFPHLNKTIYR